MGKTLYVHKDGKTIMIPAEREKEFIAKGFQRSALRTEDQVDERMPASIIKHKEKLAHMSDKELADRFKDKDDNTLRQMAWRHGYGKMSDYYVNRKNKGMSQDTNEGEMRLNKTAFVQKKAIYYNDDSMSAKFHCFRKKILKIIKTKKACYMNDVSAKNERNLYILYNFLWNVNIIFRL